jgi:hypothetical protein
LVLRNWGLHRSEDVGELVYILIAHGLLQASPTDDRRDFAGGDAFSEAFSELKPSREFLQLLCHLCLDPASLADLDRRFLPDGSVDLDWLKAAPLDPYISNAPPALHQVSAFHGMLEETLAARGEGRFEDALRAMAKFARQAIEWWPKPDLTLHDFLNEAAPYVPEFALIVLDKFHMTLDVPKDYGWDDRPVPPDVPVAEEDPTLPERDLSGLTGFGQAPAVAQHVQVYVDGTVVDAFDTLRTATGQQLEDEARQRPMVKAALGGRAVVSARIVQKHFYKNLLLST